jgi:hypothetical protein
MSQVWETVSLDPGDAVTMRVHGNYATVANVRCWYPPYSGVVIMLNKVTAAVRIGPRLHCAAEA